MNNVGSEYFVLQANIAQVSTDDVAVTMVFSSVDNCFLQDLKVSLHAIRRTGRRRINPHRPLFQARRP
jgi:hypothetical protein